MSITIQKLDAPALREHLPALAELLHDAVHHGASVSFMNDLTPRAALAFWHEVLASVERDERRVFGALEGDALVASVQLIVAMPPNQPHRAEVAKLLVHSRARRRGLGAALMQALEEDALSIGKTLLTLDTAGDDARRLYERLGFARTGDIPDYALMPDGAPSATTIACV